MIELEMAYRRLLEDKAHLEDNMRLKLDQGHHEQTGVQHEVEVLRHDITLRSKQNAELASDIHRLKQIVAARDQDIGILEGEV